MDQSPIDPFLAGKHPWPCNQPETECVRPNENTHSDSSGKRASTFSRQENKQVIKSNQNYAYPIGQDIQVHE
jgi:hypothetical protein